MESHDSERGTVLASLQADLNSKEDETRSLRRSLGEAELNIKQLNLAIGTVLITHPCVFMPRCFLCECNYVFLSLSLTHTHTHTHSHYRTTCYSAENLQQDGARSLADYEREKDHLNTEHRMQVVMYAVSMLCQ